MMIALIRRIVRLSRSIGRNKVFVAHGRNLRARDAVFQFLRALDLRPVEWSEALTALGPTPTVEEIVRKGISTASAIVVLFTGDDEVRLRGSLQTPVDREEETNFRPQARPNVIFEAGLALAIAPKRTVLVQLGDTKSFSDIIGRHVLRMDDSSEKRNEFAQRLKAAGCAANTAGTAWTGAGDFSEAISFARTKESTLRLYSDYLTRWEAMPLVPPGGLKKSIHKLAKALVREYMRRPDDCIIELRDHDAKDLINRIEERMELKDDRLPIAVIVESFETFKLAGIITPSDLPAKFEIYQASGVVIASDIWTPNPFRLRLEQTLEEAIKYMDEKKIKSGLPVVDESARFVGFLPPLRSRELIGE